MRGERLELLVNKTENLTANVSFLWDISRPIQFPESHVSLPMIFHIYLQSVTFRKTSRNLARSLFWKSVKLYLIVAAVLVVSGRYRHYIITGLALASQPLFYTVLLAKQGKKNCIFRRGPCASREYYSGRPKPEKRNSCSCTRKHTPLQL